MPAGGSRYPWLDVSRGVTLFLVILIHVALMAGQPIDTWLIRSRDFAFPLIVLSSFFTLTIARTTGRSTLGAAVRHRAVRLVVPAVLWSLLYWYAWPVFVPWLSGEQPQLAGRPEIELLAGGFMHLWYLQFLFAASAIAVALLGASGRAQLVVRSPAAWLAAGVVYAVVLREPLLESFAPLTEQPVTWMTFKRQSLWYATFIPVGIAAGLLAPQIRRAGQRPIVRAWTVASSILALTAHLRWPHTRFLREAYGVCVFAALVMPWRPPAYQGWQVLARYSYGAYILHYGVAQALVLLLLRGVGTLEPARLLLISGLAYAISIGGAMMIRRAIGLDWILPLVPVGVRADKRSAEPAGSA